MSFFVGEQFLHDGDVCNLGSINLERHTSADGRIDFNMLEETTRIAVRMLDNVVDMQDFPVERVRRSVSANRRIGIGPMGLADMFYKMGIRYGSPMSLVIAEKVMRTITEVAHDESAKLAKVRGPFPNWERSTAFLTQEAPIPMRNAALTTVAPTGTISMMHDVSGGVEPYFMLAYQWNEVLGGKSITTFNRHLIRALRAEGVPNLEGKEGIIERIVASGSVKDVEGVPDSIKEVFVTAMDLSAEEHIAMQAALQKHCDNSISKTINFPFTATREDVGLGFRSAWLKGCKGCTVYRNGSRSVQVLTSISDKKDETDGKTVVESEEGEIVVRIGASSAASSSSAGSSSSDETEILDMSSPMLDAEDCPECGASASVVRTEKCLECKACGWSACERLSRGLTLPAGPRVEEIAAY